MVCLNSKRWWRRPRGGLQPDGREAVGVQLEISLCDIRPRIWRSFYVPGDIRLDRLHRVIQIVMGWTNSHLHSFQTKDREYVMPDAHDPAWNAPVSDRIVLNERKHTLADLVTQRDDTFTYLYDFGDDWAHEVRAVKIDPLPDRLTRAVCLAGERACPPEDCGGPFGFKEMCAALRKPKHPAHRHWRDWIESFDAAAFDLDAVNRRLKRLRIG